MKPWFPHQTPPSGYLEAPAIPFSALCMSSGVQSAPSGWEFPSSIEAFLFLTHDLPTPGCSAWSLTGRSGKDNWLHEQGEKTPGFLFKFFILLTVSYLATQPFYSFPFWNGSSLSPASQHLCRNWWTWVGLRALCERKSQTKKQQIGTPMSVFGRKWMNVNIIPHLQNFNGCLLPMRTWSTDHSVLQSGPTCISISHPTLRNPWLQHYWTTPQKSALLLQASERMLSRQLKGYLLHEALLDFLQLSCEIPHRVLCKNTLHVYKFFFSPDYKQLEGRPCVFISCS